MAQHPFPLPANVEHPMMDLQSKTWYKEALHDKSDWQMYTYLNAPYIGLAGVIGGAQEAYYTFEKMPPAVSRQSWKQAGLMFRIVGRKTLMATALGALFCATDALVEQAQGEKNMKSGAAAALVTGLAFGALKPWPQPMAWPLAFMAMTAGADIFGEQVPAMLQGFRSYGPVPGRESWGDPEPPRPPILSTGASARPTDPGHFWRSAA